MGFVGGRIDFIHFSNSAVMQNMDQVVADLYELVEYSQKLYGLEVLKPRPRRKRKR